MKKILVVVAALFLWVFPSAAVESGAAGVLSLDQTLKELNAVLYWDSFFQSGMLTHNGHNITFQLGANGGNDLILFDGKSLIDLPSPFNHGGNLYFPAGFISAAKSHLANEGVDDAPRFRIAAIVVDPGHGGRDNGATGVTVKINGAKQTAIEKNITLKVGLDLYAQLKKGFPDKRILITRQKDVYLKLDERVAIANGITLKDNEAIIYISIHANSTFNQSGRGFEVWYLDPAHKRQVLDKNKYKGQTEIVPILNDMLAEEYDRESVEIAKAIAQRLKETFGSALPYRGIKSAEWFVVRNARMPSVLVELGFVSNPVDARLLLSQRGLKKIADSIYKGIVDFIGNFEESGGFIAYQ
jgi:N-acetylmuramoyl-L-alanine amidase